MNNKEQEKVMAFWQLGLGDMNKFLSGENPLPDKRETATENSWKTKPMSDNHYIIEPALKITTEQMEVIRKGHIPEVMEDHWFMYCTDSCIRYHRSWSGDMIFEALYEENEDGYTIAEVKVNTDPDTYKSRGAKVDIRLFIYLLVAELGGNSMAAWEDYAKVAFGDEI